MGNFCPLEPRREYRSLFKSAGSPLKYLELDRLDLAAGHSAEVATEDREGVLVLLSGQGKAAVSGDHGALEAELSRPDVFSAGPSGVLLPPTSRVRVEAASTLEAVVFYAPSLGPISPRLITPDASPARSVGQAHWRRDVRMVLPPAGPSSSLIVGETINQPGQWSGYPPHRHDREADDEVVLEEAYYFRLDTPEGYALQQLYDDEGWNETHCVTGDSVVTFPHGYHPTVTAPGTRAYYLWALAGPVKRYRVHIDPRFKWLSRAESILAELAR